MVDRYPGIGQLPWPLRLYCLVVGLTAFLLAFGSLLCQGLSNLLLSGSACLDAVVEVANAEGLKRSEKSQGGEASGDE